MKCRAYRKKCSAYLDGELNKGLDDFENHVQGCESCQAELEAMRLTWERLGVLGRPEPIPHFYTRLRARMISDGRKYPSRIERLLIPVTVIAAVVLGIVVGSIVGQNGGAELAGPSVEEELIRSYQLDSFQDFPSSSLGEAYITLALQE